MGVLTLVQGLEGKNALHKTVRLTYLSHALSPSILNYLDFY